MLLQFLALRDCVLVLTISLSTNRAMKREHVYSKCIRCGWRQSTSTASGNISFEEYYCKKCGDQLLTCVDIHNAKENITLAVADLRGTKPAPNGTDIPGQCTRELGLLGESATSLSRMY